MSTAEKIKIIEQNGDLYMDPDGDIVFMSPGGWGKFYSAEIYNKSHDFYVDKLWGKMRHVLLVEIGKVERRKYGN